ncbi:MAG: DUF4437 domain-containing protein [Alteromonadaceae bacterium]|nr:DUF4437 domain-containing protein [Alteromonadaceae bacterium]
MPSVRRVFSSVCAFFVLAISTSPVMAESTLVLAKDVDWGYLNPLRGDKSPAAANLWGNRTTPGATGMFVKFVDDFRSPPHIHNISYRGIVISGEVHNADKSAPDMWLPTGSYWTQPAGGDHITAAKGTNNMIYLEIDSGPYLVKPSSEQFDNGETPINLHYDNLVWLTNEQSNVVNTKGIEIAYLWEKPSQSKTNKTSGTLLKLDKGATGKLQQLGTELKLVVVSGTLGLREESATNTQALSPGSLYSVSGKTFIALEGRNDALVYVRSDNQFKVQ